MSKETMIGIGDLVDVPDGRNGKVIDTFGPACTVEFAHGERDVYSRSEVVRHVNSFRSIAQTIMRYA